MLRAQKAEEERTNYQAAMQNLQQRNQHLQQQEEQRLADIEIHRRQRLQQDHAQRTAQARCAPQYVLFCLAPPCADGINAAHFNVVSSSVPYH